MLIESISGVRGIVGSRLNPELISRYASALGEYLGGKGKVVIGRDSRPSGEAIVRVFSAALQWMGVDVVNIGIVPTPTVQLMVEKLTADAGIAITASHNPFPWNGVKYIDRTGLFMNADQVGKLMESKNRGGWNYKKSGEFGSYTEYGGAIDEHVENVLKIPYVNVKAIKARRFKVVLDAVNGGGSLALPAILKALGCTVVEVNCTPDGYFPHTPEPLPENLTDLMTAVRENGADVGMAVDPDADRLAVVDEGGRYLSEEYTLVMAVKTVLGKTDVSKPLVVTNLSTTVAVDAVTKQFGGRVLRTAIGEINVSSAMKRDCAVIGGEGNGGVILPDSHLGRDSLVGAALILQFLADGKKPLSDLYAELPQYRISKKKVEIAGADPDAVIEKLKAVHADKDVNTVDGLKILNGDRWVHIRKSNTEPILRVYSEAPTKEEAAALGDAVIGEIRGLM